MLCSRCHEVLKPVVAVDIDGTLGDYHSHFIEFATKYLGRNLSGQYEGVGEFSDSLGLEKPLYREIKLAYRQGGMKRSMPVFPGAARFVNGIREMGSGVEVWVTTTRPYLRLDNIDPDTRHWLQRHDIQYDGLLFNVDKYEKLVEIVERDRVLCVVEDQHDKLLSADALSLRSVQRRTYWNRGIMHRPGANSFETISEWISEWLYEWRVSYGGRASL